MLLQRDIRFRHDEALHLVSPVKVRIIGDNTLKAISTCFSGHDFRFHGADALARSTVYQRACQNLLGSQIYPLHTYTYHNNVH